jgi:hypothetical protein
MRGPYANSAEHDESTENHDENDILNSDVMCGPYQADDREWRHIVV